MERNCEAKTWAQAQAQSGSWAGSQAAHGCQRPAVGQDDEGHWGCRHHLNKSPGWGWN